MQNIACALGGNWPTVLHWIKQETEKPDSSDFWKSRGFDAINDSLLYTALHELIQDARYKHRIETSREPYRAALDTLVEVCRDLC